MSDNKTNIAKHNLFISKSKEDNVFVSEYIPSINNFSIGNHNYKIENSWVENSWEYDKNKEIIKLNELNFIIKFDSSVDNLISSNIKIDNESNGIGFMDNTIFTKINSSDKKTILLKIINQKDTVLVTFKK